MDEWTVVGVIATLVGLFFTVGKPILNLNKNLVKFNISIEHNTSEIADLKTELAHQRSEATASHNRLWDHNDKQDKQLSEHELRIGLLEKA